MAAFFFLSWKQITRSPLFSKKNTMDMNNKKFLQWDSHAGYIVNAIELFLLCVLAISIQNSTDASLQMFSSFLFGTILTALLVHLALREYAFRHETTNGQQGIAPFVRPPDSVESQIPAPLSPPGQEQPVPAPPSIQPKQANPRAFYDGCVSKTGRRGAAVTCQRGYGNYVSQPI